MASSGRIQNLELASILLQCVKPLIWAIISMNFWALWMLCYSTEFKVCESRLTHNLPLGFTTSTKACTQSDASLMSNFLMTFMDSILSNSSFNGSLRACDALLGEHTIGLASGFMSKWTMAFFIVLTPWNKSWEFHNMSLWIGLINLCVKRN